MRAIFVGVVSLALVLARIFFFLSHYFSLFVGLEGRIFILKGNENCHSNPLYKENIITPKEKME